VIDIPICPTCGRKTQIVQKLKPVQSGKDKDWTKFKHRCEIHGIFNGKVHKPRKEVES
jgi:ribosomal protein S14